MEAFFLCNKLSKTDSSKQNGQQLINGSKKVHKQKPKKKKRQQLQKNANPKPKLKLYGQQYSQRQASKKRTFVHPNALSNIISLALWAKSAHYGYRLLHFVLRSPPFASYSSGSTWVGVIIHIMLNKAHPTNTPFRFASTIVWFFASPAM